MSTKDLKLLLPDIFKFAVQTCADNPKSCSKPVVTIPRDSLKPACNPKKHRH